MHHYLKWNNENELAGFQIYSTEAGLMPKKQKR